MKNLGSYLSAKADKAPAHRLHGLQVQFAIDHECSALAGIHWGIIQAMGGQFVVPDNPIITYVPLHPTLCLCGGAQEWLADSAIIRSNVIDMNRNLLKGCKAYYFANNLAECF